MKDRSWGCSVTRICLKNTVTNPIVVQDRSPNAKLGFSKETIRQVEAMPTSTMDQSVTNKDSVDALNTLILRKLAKESFMNEGISEKVGYSGESHYDRKTNDWGILQEVKNTTFSCECGSHLGKEIFSSFPNLHNDMIYRDIMKSNPESFDGKKMIPEGVGSLLSRIGLDSRKKIKPKLSIFQNTSRFHKVPQSKTFVSAEDFSKSIPSEDANEQQGIVTYSSSSDLLSMPTKQASNPNNSMHTFGHTPKANLVGDAMCNDFSPSHRCSTTSHKEATTCPFPTRDELVPLENNLLRPHVNSPVHKEIEEGVIMQPSLHSVLTKGMQFRIDEAQELHNLRSKQHIESSLVGRGLVKKILRDEDEVVLLKTPELKADVHWNLRELMQREEIENDKGANLNALRNAYMLKQGIEGSRYPKELARSMVGEQCVTKHGDIIGGCGTSQRLELDIVELEPGEGQLGGINHREDSKAKSMVAQRSPLFEERMNKERLQVQKEKITRRVLLQQNHVDASEEHDKFFQGKAHSAHPRKLDISKDSYVDFATIQELAMDGGIRRDELEVLLEFLTMKQQFKENKHTNVEVVQTQAIVRDLLSRMKLDNNCSSIDSDASFCFLSRPCASELVVDDNYGGGKECRRHGRSAMPPVDTSDILPDILTRLASKDSVDSQVVFVQKIQNIDSRSRPNTICRSPFVIPSSKSQMMTRSLSTRKVISGAKNCCDLFEEYGVAIGSSMNSEETLRKHSRWSRLGIHQDESCGGTQCTSKSTNLSTKSHMIDEDLEEIVRVGSHNYVVNVESSTVTRMGTMDETNDGMQILENSENNDITFSNKICSLMNLQTKLAHDSPIVDVMPLHSAKNLESQPFVGNASTMQLNYVQEKQLPSSRNVQLASPTKRSTSKSPSSPLHHKQCRGIPTMKSSPNNRPSPLSSPQRLQRVQPVAAMLTSTPAQVRSLMPAKILSKGCSLSKPSHDLDIFPAGVSNVVVQESIALAKDSSDPYVDFRDSMLEMMQEKNLWQRQEELQDLLQCFLHLNQPVHHQLIHQAFSDVVSCGSPVDYRHQRTQKEQLKVHLSHQSSPSRQLHKEILQ